VLVTLIISKSKKGKKIEIPDEYLNAYLDERTYKIYKTGDIEIVSVTVVGEK
jgi:hypothetical protein